MQSVSITPNAIDNIALDALAWTVDELKWGVSTYVSGLYNMIAHPLETLKNVGRAICHPLETSEGVAEQLIAHPLGTAINLGLSYGTGIALNYAMESTTVNFSVQSGIEASTVVTETTCLPGFATQAIEATSASAVFIAEIACSKGMRFLRQAAKALCTIEVEH
jgi:hypothetical protein